MSKKNQRQRMASVFLNAGATGALLVIAAGMIVLKLVIDLGWITAQ